MTKKCRVPCGARKKRSACAQFRILIFTRINQDFNMKSCALLYINSQLHFDNVFMIKFLYKPKNQRIHQHFFSLCSLHDFYYFKLSRSLGLRSNWCNFYYFHEKTRKYVELVFHTKLNNIYVFIQIYIHIFECRLIFEMFQKHIDFCSPVPFS